MSAAMQPEDARRQPANPADLRRHPPKDPTCLRIRGLLRDYTDDELDAPLRAAVELHVHDCRACALALARAEHEVLRLRRAAAAAEPVEVPKGFAAGTVQRLLRELGRETSTGLRAPGAAERPGSSDRSGAGAPLPARPPARHRLRLGVFAVALLSAAAVVLCAALLWRGLHEVERSACLEAASVKFVVDDHGLPVGVDDRIGADAGVHVGQDGFAKFRLLDGDRQSLGTIRADAETRLRMQGGVPTLVDGGVDVDARGAMALQLSDGARLELGTGHYYVTASDYRSVEDILDGSRTSRPRVRVEVIEGSASILRAGMAPETIGKNSVASYQGFSAVQVEAMVAQPMLENGFRSGPRVETPVPQEVPALVGQVREGMLGTTPAAGAEVMTEFPRHGMRWTSSSVVKPNGVFEVEPEYAFSSDFVIVQVQPPMDRTDLGWIGIDALPVLRDGAGPRLPEPLVLSPSMLMAGVVSNPDQTPVQGARLVPCVVDELFGLLLPLLNLAVDTDNAGSFVLQQLPTRLAPHQQLGVLLLDATHASRYHAIPLPGSQASRLGRLNLVMEPLREVQIELPATAVSRTVEILEELRSVPPGTAIRSYTLRPTAAMVPLRCGRGRLWLRVSSSSSRLLELKEDEDQQLGTICRVGTDAAGVESSSVLRLPMQSVSPTSRFQVSLDYRHRHFDATSELPLRVQVQDEESRRGEKAQLFALGRQPGTPMSVRFLGLFDGRDDLRVGLANHENAIIAVHSDGRMAHRAVSPEQVGSVTLLLQRCGSVVVGNMLRPLASNSQQLLAVEFTPAARPGQAGQVPFVRFAVASEGWIIDRVPPGDYAVRIGSHQVQLSVTPGSQLVLR